MFLGIDIGTSAVKLSLVSTELCQVAEAQASLTVSTPQDYWSEQHPEQWWRALCEAARDLGKDNALSAVQAIGLSGQMHGAVLLDSRKAVIRPAILWNDGRSHLECEQMMQALPELGHLAGVNALPGFTAPKILWLSTHETDAYRAIAHIALPKDYIGWRLTNRLATDRSDAAGTLWLDQDKRAWSPKLCEISATRMEWLPELMDGNEVSGKLSEQAASELGLRPGIPVAAGGGDAATGAVGTGAVQDGATFISLGTSGQLFSATSSYRPNPPKMVHAYCHTLADTWFQMAAMLNGARPMQWFADVAGAPIAQLLIEAADASPDRIPLFLPYLTGERSPHGDPHIRGAFYGLAEGVGRAEMMRGVVNAVAYCFADAADSLSASGTNPDRVLAIGGGARSDLLLQTISDVLKLPIDRSDDPSTGPALGAAKLAAVAIGAATVDDLATQPRIERTFEPNSDVDTAQGLAGFRNLYQRLRGIHEDISHKGAL